MTSGIEIGVRYNLTVIAYSNVYSLYLNDVLILSDFTMTEFTDFSRSSFGFRTLDRFECMVSSDGYRDDNACDMAVHVVFVEVLPRFTKSPIRSVILYDVYCSAPFTA